METEPNFTPPEEKSVNNIKEKLANLNNYMPEQPETVYEFARFLSTRAIDTLTEQGFVLMATLALYDLQNGKDGYTRKPIQNEIVGSPPQTFELLEMSISKIREIIFDKEIK